MIDHAIHTAIPHIFQWIAAVPPPVVAPVDAYPWSDVALAAFLFVVAAILTIAEIFIISFGFLTIGALVCGVLSLFVAFNISVNTGMLFMVLMPIVGMIIVQWGFKRLKNSPLVPNAAITTDVGYHHALDRIGVSIGAVGELVTDAVPSGRARFTGSKGTDELDVTLTGSAGSRGDHVRLLRVEGPLLVATLETKVNTLTSATP